MNKTYEFSFERGQFLKFIGGLAALVLLIFCAGFLAGLALEMGQPAPILVAQFPPALVPAHALIAPEDLPAIEPVAEQLADLAPEDQPAVEGPEVEEDEAPAAVQAIQPPPPAAGPLGGKFAVQLGAFLSERNAGSMLREIKAKGYEADVVSMPDSQGRTWFLVRFGLYPNRAEASAAATDLQSREQLDALVRPSGSM